MHILGGVGGWMGFVAGSTLMDCHYVCRVRRCIYNVDGCSFFFALLRSLFVLTF